MREVPQRTFGRMHTPKSALEASEKGEDTQQAAISKEEMTACWIMSSVATGIPGLSCVTHIAFACSGGRIVPFPPRLQ